MSSDQTKLPKDRTHQELFRDIKGLLIIWAFITLMLPELLNRFDNRFDSVNIDHSGPVESSWEVQVAYKTALKNEMELIRLRKLLRFTQIGTVCLVIALFRLASPAGLGLIPTSIEDDL